MQSKTKPVVKAILGTVAILLVLSALWLFSLFRDAREDKARVSKIAHIVIQKEDTLEGVNGISVSMCDSISYFTIEQINDTVNENIAVSDEFRPCNVYFTYFFSPDDIKSFITDSFNCHGCSGLNVYILHDDSVEYVYHP